MSSIEPRGLLADGVAPNEPDDGAAVIAGAPRGEIAGGPRNALIALENEAREVLEIIRQRLLRAALPDG